MKLDTIRAKKGMVKQEKKGQRIAKHVKCTYSNARFHRESFRSEKRQYEKL